MAEYSATQTVDVEAKKLFAYISEVDNLPDYFPRITAARRTDYDRIEVAASVPDGEGGKREEQGEAWLRVEQADTTLVWGSAGPNSYEGRLDLDPLGDDEVTPPDGLGAAWGDGAPGSSVVDEQPASSTSTATTGAFTARPSPRAARPGARHR